MWTPSWPPVTPIVVDSSALVAFVTDSGPAGSWVTATVGGNQLVAPHLALFEAANALRRLALSGLIDGSEAALAHAELLTMPIALWPYEPLAERSWELRHTVTAYDAAYVALAELLETSLVTLDRRLAGASGPRCPIETLS